MFRRLTMISLTKIYKNEIQRITSKIFNSYEPLNARRKDFEYIVTFKGTQGSVSYPDSLILVNSYGVSDIKSKFYKEKILYYIDVNDLYRHKFKENNGTVIDGSNLLDLYFYRVLRYNPYRNNELLTFLNEYGVSIDDFTANSNYGKISELANDKYKKDSEELANKFLSNIKEAKFYLKDDIAWTEAIKTLKFFKKNFDGIDNTMCPLLLIDFNKETFSVPTMGRTGKRGYHTFELSSVDELDTYHADSPDRVYRATLKADSDYVILR